MSAVDLYGQCPFKFFARHVLRLPEEHEDEEGLTPLERGRFLHETFEAFFQAWQKRGHGSVTADRLEDARTLFVDVLTPRLEKLSPSDAAIERTRFLGSPVAAGLIDVVLRMEAERDVPSSNGGSSTGWRDLTRSVRTKGCVTSACEAWPTGSIS